MNTAPSTSSVQEKPVNIIVRVFHWSIAGLFIILFITGDNNDGSDFVHLYLGKLFVALILSRILWAFIGNENALWKKYVYSPKRTLNYLIGLFKTEDKNYQLHNPAGSSMILLTMSLLLILGITGILIESLFEFDGAFLFLSAHINEAQAFFIKDLHSFVAHAMLFVIAIHISGVVYSSYAYKVNMPLMMITGKVNFFKNRRKK